MEPTEQPELKEIGTDDLTAYHYAFTSRPDPEKYITKRLRDTDYELKNLGRGIAHYKQKSTGDNYYSIKGTNPQQMKDLISDVKLGLGISREDKQFIRRTNQMKNYIKDNTGDHHIMGHSLGGSIGTSMMAKSKTIRDNVKSATFYNTGYTPAFHKELTTGMTPKTARELNKKVTHHHVIGDPISMFLGSGAVGKVKKYQNNIVNPLDKHSINFFSR